MPGPTSHRRSHHSARRPSSRAWRVAAPLAVAVAAALPTTAPALAAPAEDRGRPAFPGKSWVAHTIRDMTLEEKIGQLITGYAYGATPTTSDRRNEALYGPGVDTPAEVVAEHHLGGVIYFAWTSSYAGGGPQGVAALSNGLQDAALTSGAGVPLLISTDQEQGVVTRFGPPATAFPGSMALGAGRSADDARTAARVTGEELAAVGINQNYAPVADVNVNPENPVIGVRSFSSDPALVSEMVVAQVAGYQEDAGITATAKHFPGHGDTAVDSHYGLPVIDKSYDEWAAEDLPPFQAAIDAGIDSIMTAHIVVPALDSTPSLPATLSKPILTGVLREQLGYEGVIVTDSLEMAGVRQQFSDGEIAVRAIEAGADVLLMPARPLEAVAGIAQAVESGRLTEERLDESLRRVLRLKLERGIVQEPHVDPAAIGSVVGTPEHVAAAQDVTDRTVTVLRNDEGLLPLAADPVDIAVVGPSSAQSAADALARRGHRTTAVATGLSPTPAQRGAATTAAAAADLAVVLTNKAWSTANQRAMVADVLATGTPVVHVAVRDPYDVAYLDGLRTSLATYSTTTVSMESLARVLTGEVAPTATLPVDVPVAGDRSTVLLPFGHGLTWEVAR